MEIRNDICKFETMSHTGSDDAVIYYIFTPISSNKSQVTVYSLSKNMTSELLDTYEIYYS